MSERSADLFDAAQYRAAVDDAAAAIHDLTDMSPSVSLILGTGLGKLAEEIDTEAVISYHDALPVINGRVA